MKPALFKGNLLCGMGRSSCGRNAAPKCPLVCGASCMALWIQACLISQTCFCEKDWLIKASVTYSIRVAKQEKDYSLARIQRLPHWCSVFHPKAPAPLLRYEKFEQCIKCEHSKICVKSLKCVWNFKMIGFCLLPRLKLFLWHSVYDRHSQISSCNICNCLTVMMLNSNTST